MSVGIIVMLLIIFNIRLTQAVKLTARRCLGHCVVKTLSTELTGGCRLAPAYRQRVRVVTDSGLHLGFFSDPVPCPGAWAGPSVRPWLRPPLLKRGRMTSNDERTRTWSLITRVRNCNTHHFVPGRNILTCIIFLSNTLSLCLIASLSQTAVKCDK